MSTAEQIIAPPVVFLTTAELAQRWRMRETTLRAWRFRDHGPAYFKPSGPCGPALYRITDVEAWEENHREGGTDGNAS